MGILSPVPLHHLMKRPIRVAQLSALFPVYGVSVNSTSEAKFRWFSVLMVYTVACWAAMLTILYLKWQAERNGGESLSILDSHWPIFVEILKSLPQYKQALAKSIISLFQVKSFWSVRILLPSFAHSINNARLLDVLGPPIVFFPVFIHTSSKWPAFLKNWELIERRTPYFEIITLESRLTVIFILFLTSRLGYLLVTLVVIVWRSALCLDLSSPLDYLEAFSLIQYQKTFTQTPPAAWKHVALAVAEVLSSLQWVSCNLFVTYLSIILTARFKGFNNHLQAYKLQMMGSRFWQEMREAYNGLSQMTELLDSLLSPLVMVTFIMETMNIIIYIYWLINNVDDAWSYASAAFGFVRVVLVSCVTQFSVTAVHEESKRPLDVFRLVPSCCYCDEVKRLYEQVSTDTLALSGCQFFYVTRSVILTMVSTIVTYEVVLIQFGSYELEGPISSNGSRPPFCDKWLVPAYSNHL